MDSKGLAYGLIGLGLVLGVVAIFLFLSPSECTGDPSICNDLRAEFENRADVIGVVVGLIAVGAIGNGMYLLGSGRTGDSGSGDEA